MIFEPVGIADAEGCYLAHSQMTPSGRVSKGALIDAPLMQRLSESGLRRVWVARLDASDVHEDQAAQTIAQSLAGYGVSLSAARTGRVNVHADRAGLCVLDRQSIIDANSVDEGITVATIAENQWVAAGKMIATIKIIPYAVAASSIETVKQRVTNDSISVHPPGLFRAELIQTRLRVVKEHVLDKTRTVMEQRLSQRQVSISHEQRCEHDIDALTACINQAIERSSDWILIAGASAISDRQDVIPAAITQAGGHIQRYGLPVDPGNLLLLGTHGQTQIIGLPGCARSPRYNGLDQLLDRLACGVPLSASWMNSLSVGGLLTENADRPSPRVREQQRVSVGALLLAAGSSRRAGAYNKLLYAYQGKPLLLHAAQAIDRSQVQRAVAITGFEHEQVATALAEMQTPCLFNPLHTRGMASSIVQGISNLRDMDAVLVCLGDMPHVRSETIDRLIDAFMHSPDKSIVIPVYKKRRGNPVLFSQLFFDTLLTLEGDTGAKSLCAQYPELVLEVETDDAGIVQDYDTVESLLALSHA